MIWPDGAIRPLPEGVYVQFHGPQFETPAEVRMAGVLGGDLVGMSTTLETIAAREAGLEVLGISLVTNLAAGISARAAEPRRGAGGRARGRAAAAHACWPGIAAAPVSAPTAARRPAADGRRLDRRRIPTRRPGGGPTDLLTGRRAAATSGARAELADAFSGRLEFGTAGLRGALGPGPEPDEPGGGRPGGGRAGGLPARPRARPADG